MYVFTKLQTSELKAIEHSERLFVDDDDAALCVCVRFQIVGEDVIILSKSMQYWLV